MARPTALIDRHNVTAFGVEDSGVHSCKSLRCHAVLAWDRVGLHSVALSIPVIPRSRGLAKQTNGVIRVESTLSRVAVAGAHQPGFGSAAGGPTGEGLDAYGRAASAQAGLRHRAFTANTGRCGHRKCHIVNLEVSRDHGSSTSFILLVVDCSCAQQTTKDEKTFGGVDRISQNSGRTAPPPLISLSSDHGLDCLPQHHRDPSVPTARWQLCSTINRSRLDFLAAWPRSPEGRTSTSHPPASSIITAEGHQLETVPSKK
ncbi:hypothetical protein N658DRAFT_7751 [Parathielavia hyrcaniae]|uniref:Uncharacterized protein n=1 Tax=Parathielavia hyrcaniae TaxID=113614 RepID=A0AAN6T6R2_9PEZI|nr:hypothetical protein N658DRAFT_7751 [Parathielavia hyrcaniae]